MIDGEMQEKISDFFLHFSINHVKRDLSCSEECGIAHNLRERCRRELSGKHQHMALSILFSPIEMLPKHAGKNLKREK